MAQAGQSKQELSMQQRGQLPWTHACRDSQGQRAPGGQPCLWLADATTAQQRSYTAQLGPSPVSTPEARGLQVVSPSPCLA